MAADQRLEAFRRVGDDAKGRRTDRRQSMIVLVMGVEGAGKSTVGRALAQELGWQFADGDDFHSPENKAKIHAGIPLTDEDRAPWLAAMHDQIVRWHQSGTNAVLAASALKESYRQQLFAGIPPEDYRIVFLLG